MLWERVREQREPIEVLLMALQAQRYQEGVV